MATTELMLQGSLFAAAPGAAPRPLEGAVERTLLDAGAWIDLRRDWLPGADDLFERLLSTVPWRTERRPMYDRMVDVPRLHAFYHEGCALPDPLLVTCRQALDRHYSGLLGERFATTGLCLYRDGSDSVAWHGDTIGRGARADTMVAVLSLGAPRTFLLRPRAGGRTLSFELSAGDLLVMGGSCQRTWQHAVPKTRRPVAPRISVQIRPHDVR